MQSLLQYRRCRNRLKSQLANGNRPKSSPAARPNGDLNIDIEKGIQKAWTPDSNDSTIVSSNGHSVFGQPLPDVKVDADDEASPNVVLVQFEGPDDPQNPRNWSNKKRILVTLLLTAICFIAGFASSCDSAALVPWAKAFGVTEVVESVATATFLLGFGVGCLFAGPCSEVLGRNPVYIACLILFCLFITASGLAPNIGSQISFRFISGCFASPPLVCAGGSIADMWSPKARTLAFPLYAPSAFLGPAVGPIIGGWIAQSSRVDFRWTEWASLLIAGTVLVLCFLFLPETYSPILMKWKASQLRAITGANHFKCSLEIEHNAFTKRLKTALIRPIALTFGELIIFFFALYLVIVWVILFTFLSGFAFVFGEAHDFTPGMTGSAFGAVGLGIALSMALTPVLYAKHVKLVKVDRDGGKLPPEVRLWYAMCTAPFLPISLFWLGWTSEAKFSPWSGLGACTAFGFSIIGIFISSNQYIIDAYETYSASALAGAALLRYIVAAAMTIISVPMYRDLGVRWTCTLFGCLAALMTPVPYLFYVYGPYIRSKSKFARGERSRNLSVQLSGRVF